jgi:hypothetical protein
MLKDQMHEPLQALPVIQEAHQLAIEFGLAAVAAAAENEMRELKMMINEPKQQIK